MDAEIKVLVVDMNTWTFVPQTEAEKAGKKVIKSTWAFCQKRDPSGAPTKKKKGSVSAATFNQSLKSLSPTAQLSNDPLSD